MSLERLRAARVIAVLRTDTPDEAVTAALTLAAAGVRAIELTFTIPDAAGALGEARGRLPAGVLLGAGTIRSGAQLDDALAAGAEFLVTPHLDAGLVRAMLATGRLVLPGVFTPSEVAAALAAGARVVKLFPAATGGLAHFKALRSPFPELQVVPTGGIGAGRCARGSPPVPSPSAPAGSCARRRSCAPATGPACRPRRGPS